MKNLLTMGGQIATGTSVVFYAAVCGGWFCRNDGDTGVYFQWSPLNFR